MTLTISIRAAQDGWTVQGDTVEQGMMFLRGADAETAARALAKRYSDAGQDTEVHVFLRDGSLAGRYLSVPELGSLLQKP